MAADSASVRSHAPAPAPDQGTPRAQPQASQAMGDDGHQAEREQARPVKREGETPWHGAEHDRGVHAAVQRTRGDGPVASTEKRHISAMCDR